MSKRILFSTAMILIFIISMVIQQATAQEAPKVRLSYRDVPGTTIFYKGKMYEKYGVKVEPRLLTTGPESMQAIVSGDVDVAEMGITPTATVLTKSKDLIVVSVAAWGGGLYRVMVKKDSPYKTFEDLKGKRIATAIGSGCYSAFLLYIKQKGWIEKDFQLLNSGDQEAIAGMEQGSVDAIMYWEPIVSILEYKGIAREIENFAKVVKNPAFLVANKNFAEKYPITMVKILAAWTDACDLLTNNLPAAAEIIAKSWAERGQILPNEVIVKANSKINFEPDLKDFLVEELKENWRTLTKAGKLKGPEPDWDKVIVTKYLEEGQKLRKK